MKPAPAPLNEMARLRALERYGVLDTPPDATFDSITKAVAELCDVPIALVSLIDAERQWFKSRVGLDVTETSRSLAFCSHAILTPSEILEVPDTWLDERFHDNPLVVNAPKIRFYAGKPLLTADGYALGTLCIIDYKPRRLTETQRELLTHLANTVLSILEHWYHSSVSAISRAVENTLTVSIVITDPTQPDNPISYVNNSFEVLTGYSKDEVLGKYCRFLQGEDTESAATASLQKALEAQSSCTVTLKNYRKNGTAFWNELSISPVLDPAGKLIHFLAIQRDVTERERNKKQSEATFRQLQSLLQQNIDVNTALQQEIEQRERAESQYRRYLESSPDATVIVDNQGLIKVVNTQALLMFGFTREEMIGHPIEILLPPRFKSRHPEHRHKYMLNPRLRPMGAGDELLGRHKNGTEFPVEVSLSSVGTPDEPLVSAAIRDISERLYLESKTQELSRDLAHMGRFTTMGQMAAGLAHELNQPLTAIIQTVDAALLTAQSQQSNGEDMRELLSEIEHEAQRAGDIIKALRQFISKDKSKTTEFCLNELVNQAVKLISTEARSNKVEIATICKQPMRVEANRVQIAQVLINLMRNSVDAIIEANSPQRCITVIIEKLENKAIISVSDTGPGLVCKLENLKPFESSKAGGMGVGLTISRSLISAHGGKLWADSNATSGGATLRFSLPIERQTDKQVSMLG